MIRFDGSELVTAVGCAGTHFLRVKDGNPDIDASFFQLPSYLAKERHG